MPPRTPSKQLARARRLRREQTAAEEILWRSLRNRAIGGKFRRQLSIGRYVVDFASVDAKLVVEVDGPTHESDEQAAFDRNRDAWLRQHGWQVLRIPNAIIIGGGDIPLNEIRSALAGPSSDLR